MTAHLFSDDNILQEMTWHLEQGDLVPTAEAKEDREQALRTFTLFKGPFVSS